MSISAEFSPDKLSELIEREMADAGMPARRQNGKTNSRTVYKRKIDGLIVIWNLREGEIYDDLMFSYKVMTDQTSLFRDSVLGPNPAHFRQESFERQVAERVQILLARYGFNFYKGWGRIVEYKKT